VSHVSTLHDKWGPSRQAAMVALDDQTFSSRNRHEGRIDDWKVRRTVAHAGRRKGELGALKVQGFDCAMRGGGRVQEGQERVGWRERSTLRRRQFLY